MIIRIACTILLTIFLDVLLLTIFESCRHNPTAPEDARPLLTSAQYKDINIVLTDFDVVRITHQAGLDLRNPSMARIAVGIRSSTTFVQLASSSSTFDANLEQYVIHYDLSVKLDSSKLVEPFTIRYYFSDSTFSDVDTSAILYTFPYASARFLADSSILGIHPRTIEGAAVVGSKFYYHPLNEGFYVYDTVTRQSSIGWSGYHGGAHIAADSNYVFCDISHQQIARYNLLTGTADSPLPDLGSVISIDGMAISNHLLFVLVADVPEYLKVFTLDGVLKDSLSFANFPNYSPFHEAIDDSIIYAVDWNLSNDPAGQQLSRFNLRTNTLLSNVAAPTKEVIAITINDHQLYYSSATKDFVGVVPVADLLPVSSVHKTGRR